MAQGWFREYFPTLHLRPEDVGVVCKLQASKFEVFLCLEPQMTLELLDPESILNLPLGRVASLCREYP